ncbi:MAG: S9 family peptidase [Rhodanobacter sp.]
MMKIRGLAFAVAVILAIPAFGRPFTPQDLVELSRIANIAVSPDGRWLVWDQSETDLAANKGRHDLWRLDLQVNNAVPEKFASMADVEESDPAFGPKGELYFLSHNKDGKTAIWRVAMTGEAPVRVTGDYDLSGFKFSPKGDAVVVWADRPVGARSLDNIKPPAPDSQGNARIYDHLFARHWATWEDGQRSQLFILPLANGRAMDGGHTIEAGLVGDVPSKPRGSGDDIAWSSDSRTVYFSLRQAGRIEPLSINFDIFAAAADGSTPPANLTAENQAIDALPTVSPDGRYLASVATKRPGYDSDRNVLMVRELATGKVRALTEHWDRSVDSIHWAPHSAALYVTAADRLDHPLFRVDLADGEVHRLTAAGHVGDVAMLPEGGVVYSLDSLTAPADLWRRDEDGRTTRLTSVNSARLAEVDWPTMQRFSFKGANGDPVWGFVLRPASLAPGGKAPVALLVHGGPQNSFSDSWSSYLWNASAWAGHGFAVVSIDFHGSTGYGQAFTDSVNLDWGGKPLVDLELGLKAATERFGFLDDARICAAGGSYGGYMMNWIEGNWSLRFKCLVQAEGVFDARAMTYETDELRTDEWDYGDRPYYEAPEAYEKWNPVNYVAKWATPMLVITGEKDFRSPDTQAIAAFTALQLRDVPSRLIVFPDEGHRVLKPKNSLEWYAEVFRWMDRWAGSKP